jgi:hypothetical protein
MVADSRLLDEREQLIHQPTFTPGDYHLKTKRTMEKDV